MPCEAPLAAASMKFALVFSTCIFTVPIVVGRLGLGPEDLRDEERARGGHHGRRDEVFQRRPHRHVGQHDGARDVRHAARHHREELGRRHRRDVGRDQDRRLRLADEDVRRHAERLGAGDLHRLLHPPRHALHDHLDDPEVVEDREERADEDDDREHLEGEDEAPDRACPSSRRACPSARRATRRGSPSPGRRTRWRARRRSRTTPGPACRAPSRGRRARTPSGARTPSRPCASGSPGGSSRARAPRQARPPDRSDR